VVVAQLEVVAVQTVRPDASRNTVRFPSTEALPVVLPLGSRNVVRAPTVLAVPTVRPDASRIVVCPLGVFLVAM
jgi:hypothetical protein